MVFKKKITLANFPGKKPEPGFLKIHSANPDTQRKALERVEYNNHMADARTLVKNRQYKEATSAYIDAYSTRDGDYSLVTDILSCIIAARLCGQTGAGTASRLLTSYSPNDEKIGKGLVNLMETEKSGVGFDYNRLRRKVQAIMDDPSPPLSNPTHAKTGKWR